ncbi:uncharacterized protein LOC115922767 [Strongylocentrotus purpuratus]|uniref:Soluble interferon alpha/beta receptor OPG204 n=1 Tax=Strongylocentrotus purpuratus TaxID=7668 RepID=A0A7M7NNE2_STRPU|nr:uncharacterized protein LOC115922767 [Strongylocentrotus purpuratus]
MNDNMRDLEVMRRLVFLLISVWSVLGNETMTEATDCLADLDSNKLSFLEETAILVFSPECQHRVLQCRSVNFCSIQWFFNDIPYDSWSLGNNSDTKYKLEDSNQTLNFLSTDVDAGGTYTCVVSNGVRNITRSINMSIEKRPWINKPIPFESSSAVCKDQMAVLGGNASFFCQFKYRNDLLLQYNWKKLNQTNGIYEKVDFYDIHGTEFSYGSRKEDGNVTQTQTCQRKPLKILSTWLNITNVTEEALGRYQVMCKISQYITTVNLTLSLEEHVVTVTDTTSVVVVIATLIILLSLFVLSWKRYGTDVKLWYHDHRTTLETEEIDNKLYDAYIISCYEGQDKSFVDTILCPSLQDQYKLFIRERDATFGSVESEEIVEALTKSRRCIVLLSADFYRHSSISSSQSTSGMINTTAVQLTSSSSSSSSPSSPSFSGNDLSGNEWHLFELHHALDTMHPNVIPLLYRDSGPTSLSNTDSNAKLIDHVLKDVTCLKWKQKGETRLDDWAMKRLRLRLPPRRRSSNLPSEQSSYITMPVMSAATPSNISSSISLTSPLLLTAERPYAVDSSLQHLTALSGPESSSSGGIVNGEALDSSRPEPSQSPELSFMSMTTSPPLSPTAPMSRPEPSQSPELSFMSMTTSPPLSPTAPMSLSSSYGSCSITSPDSQGTSQSPSSPCTSSSLFSPSHLVHANETDNLNSFQEYQPDSNTFNSSLSTFQFFLRPKTGPNLIDNESKPGYI